MAEIHLVLIFMIAAAIIAVEIRDLLSAVVAVGAVGIGLSMAFLLLKAPDLAIMQLVVEILSLIILVRATIRKDLPFSVSGRWLVNTVVTLAFLASFFGAAWLALKDLPVFGDPIMKLAASYFEEGAKTGALNIVSAVTLEFRVLDTMGEAVILFASVIGVLAVARMVSKVAKT